MRFQLCEMRFKPLPWKDISQGLRNFTLWLEMVKGKVLGRVLGGGNSFVLFFSLLIHTSHAPKMVWKTCYIIK